MNAGVLDYPFAPIVYLVLYFLLDNCIFKVIILINLNLV